MTSSGSAVPANAVKAGGRRRRRRSLGDGSPGTTRRLSRRRGPPARGAKAGSRLTRSSSSTWALTRCSSSLFQPLSSSFCRSTVSWYRLTRTSERTRANSSAWSNGLVTKSPAPASIAATFSWSPLAVIITTGRNSVRGSRRRPPADLVAVQAGTMSSSTMSGTRSSRNARASSPDDAPTTVKPRGARTASSSRRLAAGRPRPARWRHLMSAPLRREGTPAPGTAADADRLLQVSVEIRP